MSDHDYPESSGIWIQMPSKEVDLLQYDYMDREFSVLNGKYLFKFEKIKGIFINELEVWMHKNKLFWSTNFLKANNITAMEELEDFKDEWIEDTEFETEKKEELLRCIKIV